MTHTWSLAIEEQWYLLLPIVLVLLLPRVKRRRWWVIIFVALALLSAGLMSFLHMPGSDPSREYYGTDTRLLGLLLGAALASLLTPGAIEKVRRPAAWLAPIGLAALVLLLGLTDDTSDWLYNGGFLLVALVSAVVLASVVARPQGFVARVLAWRPIVWIGTVSYGLYLWHWPVYVILSPGRTGISGTALLVLRFAVTFAVAALSYYLVERPVRRGALNRLTQPQRLAAVLAAPLVVLGLVGFTAATTRPSADDSLEAIRDAARHTPTPGPTSTPSPTSSASDPAVEEEVRAILVGDSVALSLFAAYTPGTIRDMSVLPGTEFGCGLVPFEAAINGSPMPLRDECVTWEAQRRQRIAESGANLGVMFPGPWEQYDRWIDGDQVSYTDPRWKAATVADYQRVLEELSAVTPNVAVVLNTCHGAPDLDLPDAVLFQAGRYPDVVNDPARVAAVNEAAREAVDRSGVDAAVIDPGPILCKDGYQGTIDGIQMHTDGVHFTEEGARWYWKWLGPQLLKAAQKPSATPSAPVP